MLDGLAVLMASSLLRPQDDVAAAGDGAGRSVTAPRLTMLETIREYGTELLAERSETGETRSGTPPSTWRWPRRRARR